MEQSAVNLVYAAPVPYSSFAQRAHQFVAFYNRNGGGRTLWIDPYPSRLPRLADLRRNRLRIYTRDDAAVEQLSPPFWCPDPAMRPRWLRRVVWRPVLQHVAAFVQGEDWMLAIGTPAFSPCCCWSAPSTKRAATTPWTTFRNSSAAPPAP